MCACQQLSVASCSIRPTSGYDITDMISAIYVQDQVKPVTFWLVLDPVKHADLLAAAMRYLLNGSAAATRVAMVFYPSAGTTKLHRFLYAVSALTSRADKISPFLLALTQQPQLWEALAAQQAGAMAQDGTMAQAIEAAKEAGLNAVMLGKALQTGAASQQNFEVLVPTPHLGVLLPQPRLGLLQSCVLRTCCVGEPADLPASAIIEADCSMLAYRKLYRPCTSWLRCWSQRIMSPLS
jgi:hypothetical protein